MVFDEFEDDRYLTALDAGYKWAISINTTSDNGQDVSSEEDAWGSWNRAGDVAPHGSDGSAA